MNILSANWGEPEMKDDNKPSKAAPATWQVDIHKKLTEHGFSDAATQAMIEFDSLGFIWNHALIKGELPKKVISALELDIDLSHFHCLTAILRIQSGIGRETATQATIGLLAEELNIDPSRASRVASDLVTRGYLKREAAQEDGRKSVVVLTPSAEAVFSKFRDMKWAKFIGVFSNWKDDDISTFAKLFGQYIGDMQRVSSGE